MRKHWVTWLYMCICMFVYMYVLCICIFVCVYQGFIQVILISVWLHKKLNLHKILEHVGIEILSEILFFTRFLLSWAIYLSFRCKKAKIFQELYPLNPHQGSTLNRLQSLQHLETFSCILQHLKTQSYIKKWAVVELLG